jgi:hypothetical protein
MRRGFRRAKRLGLNCIVTCVAAHDGVELSRAGKPVILLL